MVHIKQAETDYVVFLKTLERIRSYFGEPRGKLMLDVGCGARIPQVLLFHNYGYKIIGIDIEIPERFKSLEGYRFPVIIQKKIGKFRRCIKEYTINRKYYKNLERLCNKHLSFKDLDVREMDATHLKFPGNYFDIVISNAVFEHILDMSGVCKELKRIMKKGAFAFIGIHLFPSLSGAHCSEWSSPSSVKEIKVPLWNHLRKNLYPTNVTLNRLRERDYRNIFKECFKIVDWIQPTFKEGEEFLTEEIEKELSDYSKEELLKRSVVTILQK